MSLRSKTIIVIVVFLCYWIATFAFIFPKKNMRKVAPKIAWCYDQLFGQKWDFFTQPHTNNDEVYFVFKKKDSNAITDSINVLQLLWNNKIAHKPFNRYEDILGHIMMRQSARVKENVYAPTFDSIAFNTAMHNIKAMGKLMLAACDTCPKFDSNYSFRLKFYSNYIAPLHSKECKKILETETSFESYK